MTMNTDDLKLTVAKIFKCHPNVRWKTEKGSKEKVLQQAWVCMNTGSVEWRTVEIVN